MKYCLHISLNRFTHSSRVLKECRTVLRHKLVDKVFVAALHDQGLPEFEEPEQGVAVRRIRLVSRNPVGFLPLGLATEIRRIRVLRRAWSMCFILHFILRLIKFIELSLRIFSSYARFKLEFVHCHNLSTLPLGVLFKLIRRVRLVYDAHELETEVIPGRTLRKLVNKFAERLLIRFADTVLVVNDSIAEWYRAHYHLNNIHVLFNTPERAARPNSGTTPILRNHFSLDKDDRIYLYQGGISYRRKIEVVLEAFAEAPPNLHLVCMGYGDSVDLVKEYEARHPNIHYYPAVPPGKLLSYTRSADVGISTIGATSLSYYYCLPNKFFEYAAAELPIIVNDLPEMRRLVEKYQCGLVAKEFSRSGILAAIIEIGEMDLAEMARNSGKLADSINWEAQDQSLLQAYGVR